MKDAEVRLELESTTLTFNPGQDVRGIAIVVVRNTIKPRMINVELIGDEYVYFTRTTSRGPDGSRTETTTYTAKKYFIHEQLHVWEPNSIGESASLPPGEYRFPFSFLLSPTAEYYPSFSGALGHVMYFVRATIDLGRKDDPKAKVDIDVIASYKVSDPKYLSPVGAEDTKVLDCFCCASPPITCKVTCPVGGVLPGDSIKPVITISNPSDSTLQRTILYIAKITTYWAQGASEKTTEDIFLHKFPGRIPPGTQSLSLAKDVTVPADLTPSFSSTLISLSYKMSAVVVMPGMSFNLYVGAPLFIGNARDTTNSGGAGPSAAPQQGQPDAP